MPILNDAVSNVQNELLVVGYIYKNPESLVDIAKFIRSKYDFADDATRFFYDCATILFQTRTQTFNKASVTTFMTEDTGRFSNFKRYGGYKTIASWIELASDIEFGKCIDTLKKWSLLREYQRQGFEVEKIISHKKFDLFTAQDIYKIIRSIADKTQTVIMSNAEVEVLNSEIMSAICGCMEKPDMGVMMQYPIINDMFRGMKMGTVMGFGALSNTGKTRFMITLAAYASLVRREPSFILLNEMSVESMRFALLTTVINNPEFKKLHGVDIQKNEREIGLGLWRGKNGQFIYRHTDSDGNATETIEDFIARVTSESEEYKKVAQVAMWLEDQTHGVLYAKNISTDYSDSTLEYEIRRIAMTHNVRMIFYDTFKGWNKEDWTEIKLTATRLTALAEELKIFIYISMQLTDDANGMVPDALTSSQIASCKHVKHVLTSLLLVKQIDPKDYGKYKYLSKSTAADADWGTPTPKPLSPEKKYMIFNTDKNRLGAKKKIVFEVDLDRNVWIELGELQRE